ncbi:MAG TPA: nitrilase-related carbon-nitrogen hydrolase, partial [Spirochaetia bacterium]|nr:nitrilase-related carbon-nitrogen hydrolase [Spirochaetia bacterium]
FMISTSEHRRAGATLQLICLLIGAIAFTFVGWRYNVPIAAWISPIFLLRYFRDARRWYVTLAAIPLLAIASYIQLAGGWDLDPWAFFLLPFLRPALLVGALYADRYLSPRLPRGAASLVFPSVYVALDYLFSLTPFGTILSISATQFGMPGVAQIASIAGVWGIGFLINWTASISNLLWEDRARMRDAGPVAIVFAAVLGATLLYGGARTALVRPSSQTVRVASITVPHPRDYWSWIDAATPADVVRSYASELTGLQNRLFEQSEKAVGAGSKIVFWSEGDAVITPEDKSAFFRRAAEFSRTNRIYLAASLLELHYGSTISDNKVIMFTPQGTQGFSYVKTKSWYPTDSDGQLATIDTPYGRLAAAVCFDMDFPGFINSLGRQKSDIVLVPAYDSAGIRPYHTEVGLMRAIENGFSMVRQTNEGTSMAVDGVGHPLSRQEFFETDDPIMFTDVPTRRVRTLYAWAGDWFAYGSIASAAALIALGILFGLRRRRHRP